MFAGRRSPGGQAQATWSVLQEHQALRIRRAAVKPRLEIRETLASYLGAQNKERWIYVVKHSSVSTG